MRSRSQQLTLVLGLAAMALAACSGGGGGMASPGPMAPPMIVRQEDNFGTGFGNFFRANPNSEPGTPQASDLMATTLTAEPRPVM